MAIALAELIFARVLGISISGMIENEVERASAVVALGANTVMLR